METEETEAEQKLDWVKLDWVYHLVASLAILHLVMAALSLLPGQLAPRLCTPIFRAIFRLLRKMSEARCLSKWRSDIQSALDEQMKVSF